MAIRHFQRAGEKQKPKPQKPETFLQKAAFTWGQLAQVAPSP